MKNLFRGGVLFLLVLSFFLIETQTVLAVASILRGQTKGFALSPGETETVYYVADGHAATLVHRQPFVWYWWKMPYMTIDIYCSNNFSGPWYDLYNDRGITYKQKKVSLLLSNGIYKIVLKCYGKTGVYDSDTGSIAYLTVH